MNNYKLYVHLFPNGKKYFGITCRDVKKRWGSNGCNYNNNDYLQNAIKKYGWNNIQHIILFDNLSKEIASECEKYLIAKFHTQEFDFGYNLAEGGSINSGWHYSHTEDTKRKLSEIITEWHQRPEVIEKLKIANKNRKPVSEETIKKLSDSHKGLVSGMKGKHHSEASKRKMSESQKGKVISEWQKQRISEANRGRVVSEETREKLRKANLGRKLTAEQKEKMRQAKLGKPSPKKGTHLSEEQKKKISDSLKAWWKENNK